MFSPMPVKSESLRCNILSGDVAVGRGRAGRRVCKYRRRVWRETNKGPTPMEQRTWGPTPAAMADLIWSPRVVARSGGEIGGELTLELVDRLHFFHRHAGLDDGFEAAVVVDINLGARFDDDDAGAALAGLGDAAVAFQASFSRRR